MRSIRPADLALSAVLAATGLLELVLADDVDAARPVAAAVLALVVAAAILLRTPHPLVCLAVVVALVLVVQVPAAGLAHTAALVLACLVALASVGRRYPDRVSVPAAVGTVSVFVIGAAFTSRPWDVVIALLSCGAAWGAGRMLRREAERNAALSTLASELVAQRELRAREAVRAERLRMARELHDAVAHTVSVMTLHVGGVRRQLDADTAHVRERDLLVGVEQLGRDAVAELHRAVGVLRSPEVDDEGDGGQGAPALAPQPRLTDVGQLASRIREAGVAVDVRVDGVPRSLPTGLDLAAYRVVQEALTNVLKHADGARASVTISYADTEVSLVVEDDGGAGPRSGTRPALLGATGGHGLRGMRERVALYGGVVEAGPSPDRGFCVSVTLPLPADHVP